ncbi:hypothetical protein NST63_18160 [Heyndrickxia sp. FSL W8-0496]|uniref:hypothetical protein n=1 Tax=Heyndrickxia sp. FSL W8-0496 TaxID=2954702 RepID=UPI0030F8226D
MHNDHPVIENMMKTGCPTGIRNLVSQPEFNGIDFFGKEINSEELIVIDNEENEVVCKELLDDYLMGVHEFKFYPVTKPLLDHFEQKIEVGNMIAEDTKRGEIINKENTDDFEFYLSTHYGFRFTIAD